MKHAAGQLYQPTDRELRRGKHAILGMPSVGGTINCRSKFRKFTPHRSGALIAFFTAELSSGMIINDLKLMTGKNGYWIALPAQWQFDRDSQPRTDINGKALYSPVIEFTSCEVPDQCAHQGQLIVDRDLKRWRRQAAAFCSGVSPPGTRAFAFAAGSGIARTVNGYGRQYWWPTSEGERRYAPGVTFAWVRIGRAF